jgi:hypothetical protein
MEAPTPELADVESYVSYLLDDDRTSFSYAEACQLADALGVHESAVIGEMKAYGLTYLGRPAAPRRVRGVNTSSNDRWFGPGSSPSHGGSGWEQISGFAGQIG